jgi:hypothetical protein
LELSYLVIIAKAISYSFNKPPPESKRFVAPFKVILEIRELNLGWPNSCSSRSQIFEVFSRWICKNSPKREPALEMMLLLVPGFIAGSSQVPTEMKSYQMPDRDLSLVLKNPDGRLRTLWPLQIAPPNPA